MESLLQLVFGSILAQVPGIVNRKKYSGEGFCSPDFDGLFRKEVLC